MATNLTSGEQSGGRMTIYYISALLSINISIVKNGNNCVTSVMTFDPGSVEPGFPELSTTNLPLDLAQRLFYRIEPVVRDNLLETITHVVSKNFSNLVESRNDLCTLLEQSSTD